MDVLKKVPVREQDAKVRAANFDEVCLGYNKEEAMEEAARCINCKNAQCIKGCPVAIDIPGFIEKVKNGDVEAAYQVISEASSLPAVSGSPLSHGHMMRRIKAGGADISYSTGKPVLPIQRIPASQCIAIILNQPKAIAAAKFLYSLQIKRISQCMGNHHCLRAF